MPPLANAVDEQISVLPTGPVQEVRALPSTNSAINVITRNGPGECPVTALPTYLSSNDRTCCAATHSQISAQIRAAYAPGGACSPALLLRALKRNVAQKSLFVQWC